MSRKEPALARGRENFRYWLLLALVVAGFGLSFRATDKASQAATDSKQTSAENRRLIAEARRLIVNLREEARKRTDQTCTLFERSHLADVQQLRQVYRYLRQLRPGEETGDVARIVIGNLLVTERKAKHDTAPDYCDAPGVGRPEPDPVVPKRPRGIPVP